MITKTASSLEEFGTYLRALLSSSILWIKRKKQGIQTRIMNRHPEEWWPDNDAGRMFTITRRNELKSARIVVHRNVGAWEKHSNHSQAKLAVAYNTFPRYTANIGISQPPMSAGRIR